MRTLDQEFEVQMDKLETEWRHAYVARVAARAQYERVARRLRAQADLFELVRDRLDRAEHVEKQFKIEMERADGHARIQD